MSHTKTPKLLFLMLVLVIAGAVVVSGCGGGGSGGSTGSVEPSAGEGETPATQPGGGDESEGPAGEVATGGEESGGAEAGGGAEAEAGGGKESGGEAAAMTEGKTVFTTNCSSCHTLKEAGASGTVGPNLDELEPSLSTAEQQVIHGGGGMPAFKGQLSSTEIKAVSTYVSSVAGSE